MNIQFISGFILNTPTTHATANCSKDLLKSLMACSNLNVRLIGEVISSDNYDAKRRDFIYHFRRIIKWPARDPDAEEECYRDIETNNDSDIVIVCHQPYEGVHAVIRYKKKHPRIKMYLCLFDPIASEVDKELSFFWKLLFPLTRNAEFQAFQYFDGIFHMECNRKKYQSKRFQEFSSKFHYIDLPVIHNLQKPSSMPICYTNQLIRMLYSGKLNTKYRSPNYLVEVLKSVPPAVELRIDFYSKGDCENSLKEVSQQDKGFCVCGYVPKATLDTVMEEADVYVNIGNKYSSMLPSKLLSYFEQGKPVIHVSNQLGDACIPYMERYPLGLIIYENDPVDISASRVSDFLRNTYKQRISSEEICRIFYKNTPEWSAKEIVNVIQRDVNG